MENTNVRNQANQVQDSEYCSDVCILQQKVALFSVKSSLKTHKNDDPKLWEGKKKKLNEKRERGKELKINV